MNGPVTRTSVDVGKAEGLDLRALAMLVWRQRAQVALATVLAAVVTLLVAFLLPRAAGDDGQTNARPFGTQELRKENGAGRSPPS